MQENLNPLLMREAIRLSAEGFPAPNPHVGCLVAAARAAAKSGAGRTPRSLHCR